jgi:uncharacterized protein YdeI (YjbR/CyaY-like superfamily)
MVILNKITFECLDPGDRRVWRDWLSANNERALGIWLDIEKKNSKKKGAKLEEAVEEALCFGWIDSTLNVVDETRFKLFMTPRREGSIWSRINKNRVEKLIKEGLMTTAGLKKIESAKIDGSWNKMDAVEEMIAPEDCRKALLMNEIAGRNFESFNDSVKKQILWWIGSAKRHETRARRIQLAVAMAKQNKKTIPKSI